MRLDLNFLRNCKRELATMRNLRFQLTNCSSSLPVCSFQRKADLLRCRAKARSDLLPVFGGLEAVVRPDPIPNSAVKRSVADGSGFKDSARVGSRQIFQ